MASNVVQFTATPRLTSVQVSTANTNRDGSGTIVDVITAVAAGTRISKITVEATGTTTAGMVRLYVYDGTNTRLWKEINVTAITPSGTQATFTYTLSISDGFILPSSSHKIQASTHNAETFNIFCEGADY